MTPRANSLTDRATKTAASPQRWTISASDARAFTNALQALGYEADPLLAEAGLQRSDFDDPDARVSCETLGTLLTRAHQQRFTPNLGLELARVTPLGAYPLLDYLVLTADDVAAGVHQLRRYYQIVGTPMVMTIDEEAEPVCVHFQTFVAPLSIEYGMSLMVLHLGTETSGAFKAESVSFAHRPDHLPAFEQAYGCPVEVASSNTVRISRASWRLPLRRRDPVLRQFLELQADAVLARLSARTGFASEVQRALASRVAGGDASIAAIGREFAMSDRTLQRRLAAEGASYQELLDEARREAAGRHLSNSTLAIGEVAYLVGYSEPAPFHRAFKRWYGMTPDVFRQKHRQAP